jgi:transposase
VIHPADVPTTDKERQQKDDVRDSRKIARSLRNGELEGINVIGKMEEADRQLVRHRWLLAKDRKRVMNRIKSHLYFTGPVPLELQDGNWSRAYVALLHQKAAESPALAWMVKEYEMIRDLERDQMKQLRALFKKEPYATQMKLLRSVPGVGFLSALVLITEIGDMQRFSSSDKLAFFVGLVPSTDSSGDNERANQRTKRGNQRLRTTLIECAWVAIRQDEELGLAYANLRKRMDGPHAIIKIAKKLLNRIRKVWLSGQEYAPPIPKQDGEAQ